MRGSDWQSDLEHRIFDNNQGRDKEMDNQHRVMWRGGPMFENIGGGQLPDGVNEHQSVLLPKVIGARQPMVQWARLVVARKCVRSGCLL